MSDEVNMIPTLKKKGGGGSSSKIRGGLYRRKISGLCRSHTRSGPEVKLSSTIQAPIYIRWDNDQERMLKTIFFKFKSFLEWGSWWSLLPLGPNWHLQLLQLLFRYIEAGGIPSILFHYIALLFSTTICWYPPPFWLPFYFMCARGASSRSW